MKTRIGKVTFGMLGAVMLLAASSVQMVAAQTAPTSQERWLHVRWIPRKPMATPCALTCRFHLPKKSSEPWTSADFTMAVSAWATAT